MNQELNLLEKSGSAKSRITRIAPLLLVVIAVVTTGLTIYFWQQSQGLKQIINSKETTTETAGDENKNLIAQISQFLVLPTDEEPTIATVSDPEALKDQPFFKNAKKGYKVLIYSKAQKAILYDPENKKIVDVAPINIGGEQPSP